MENELDVVVIGGGPAGENVAGRCEECGLSVAVVEAELLGGECSFWACMPSKALLRPGAVLAAVRRVPGAAEAATGAIDAAAALARRDWITGGWDDAGQVRWLEGTGAAFVRGRGRIAGELAIDALTPATAAAFVGAGLLSALLFPIAALSLLKRCEATPSLEAATEGGTDDADHRHTDHGDGGMEGAGEPLPPGRARPSP